MQRQHTRRPGRVQPWNKRRGLWASACRGIGHTGEDGPGESRVTIRCCGNCRHFQRINGSTTGHCTNPLVVSHQGGLVMYREAEVGCRRGWKEDLFEPIEPANRANPVPPLDIAAEPADRDRAAAWADTFPDRLTGLQAPYQENSSDNLEDELLDPRRTRNVREAIRRARESRQRELHTSSRREPAAQPILPPLSDDTLLDERPLPPSVERSPIVPSVTAEEVRARAIEARRANRALVPPVDLTLREDDERFTAIPTHMPDVPEPEFTPVPADDALVAESTSDDWMVGSTSFDAPVSDAERAAASYAIVGSEDVADQPEWSAGPASAPELIEDDAEWGDEIEFDAQAPSWPDEAPWAQEVAETPAWEPRRPKRRSFFDSIFHRKETPRVQPEYALEYVEDAWEDEEAELPIEPVAAAPVAAWEELPGVAEEVEQIGFEELSYEEAQPRPAPVNQPHYALPPLPFDDLDEGEDVLLMEADLSAVDDEEQEPTPLPHICATCRYFRPAVGGGTCGNAFAYTYKRAVDEQSLSCASSIGAWWLPSDRYWELLGDVSHHGQPTPLLDRLAAATPNQDERGEIDRTST